jgi:acetyl esterase/lipase
MKHTITLLTALLLAPSAAIQADDSAGGKLPTPVGSASVKVARQIAKPRATTQEGDETADTTRKRRTGTVQRANEVGDAPGGTVHETYKHLPDGDLVLDVDLPKGDGPFPVVVYVHGGAWNDYGETRQFKGQSVHMAELGVAGVLITYRGRKRGGFDENMADLMDAMGYVRTNAARFHFDLNRVGWAGGSAGAHLSAIAAQRTPECIAYVGFNGLYDVIHIGQGRFGKPGNEVGADHPFLGKMTPERQREVSAIYQIKTPPPATLLLHGTADTTIDLQQSVRFAEAIRAKGGRAEVKLYEGEVHSFFNLRKYDETLKDMETFLLDAFANQPTMKP